MIYVILLILFSFLLILGGIYCIATKEADEDRLVIAIIFFIVAVVMLIGCGYNFNEIIST